MFKSSISFSVSEILHCSPWRPALMLSSHLFAVGTVVMIRQVSTQVPRTDLCLVDIWYPPRYDLLADRKSRISRSELSLALAIVSQVNDTTGENRQCWFCGVKESATQCSLRLSIVYNTSNEVPTHDLQARFASSNIHRKWTSTSRSERYASIEQTEIPFPASVPLSSELVPRSTRNSTNIVNARNYSIKDADSVESFLAKGLAYGWEPCMLSENKKIALLNVRYEGKY